MWLFKKILWSQLLGLVSALNMDHMQFYFYVKRESKECITYTNMHLLTISKKKKGAGLVHLIHQENIFNL